MLDMGVHNGTRMLTVAEVAEMFRVAPKTVTRWANAGQIHAIRTPGGHRRFHADDIRAAIVSDQP